MRTVAPQQTQPQKRVSSSLARAHTAPPGPNRHSHPLLHLQRTVGNQAVQRLLQATLDDREARSGTHEGTRLTYDFSQVPIYPKSVASNQANLTVSSPGDIEEQEADRVSDQVMRMPAPRLQRACACGGGCPECQTAQPGQADEQLQTKRGGSSDSRRLALPPIVHDIVRSPGQPLDPLARAFMEPRFGHDFSQVRVHTDPQAAALAHGVNAKAFTVGQAIVFGSGHYAPETPDGKTLLAHELTHVLQQGRHPQRAGAYLIQRDLQGIEAQLRSRFRDEDDPRLAERRTSLNAQFRFLERAEGMRCSRGCFSRHRRTLSRKVFRRSREGCVRNCCRSCSSGWGMWKQKSSIHS